MEIHHTRHRMQGWRFGYQGSERSRNRPFSGRRSARHGDDAPSSDEPVRHRGPRWGGRGRRHHRVGKGDVRAAMLLLLDEQPAHGYQIIRSIEEQSRGLWRPSAGSVYPALQQLEDEGLVSTEQGEGRRVYQLTDAGRAYVEQHRDELTAARDAVTATVDENALRLQDLVAQVETATSQVAQVGTSQEVALARDILISTRRQLYRVLAGDADLGKTAPDEAPSSNDTREDNS